MYTCQADLHLRSFIEDNNMFLEFMFRSCVATMTVVVVCGAGCPDGTAFTRSGDNKSSSPVPLRGLPAPLLGISSLFSRGQGNWESSYSHPNCLSGSVCRCYCAFLSLFLSLHHGLSFSASPRSPARAFARPVARKRGKRVAPELPLSLSPSPAKSTK